MHASQKLNPFLNLARNLAQTSGLKGFVGVTGFRGFGFK